MRSDRTAAAESRSNQDSVLGVITKDGETYNATTIVKLVFDWYDSGSPYFDRGSALLNKVADQHIRPKAKGSHILAFEEPIPDDIVTVFIAPNGAEEVEATKR